MAGRVTPGVHRPGRGPVTRRHLLGGLTAAGALAALSACTGEPEPDGTGPSPSGTPTTPSPTPTPTPPPELPGGGTTLFPSRRMVALYGTPGTASLGLLGEQDVAQALTRVAELAEEYQPYSEEPVRPALEIIATVATSAPGATGDYTAYVDRDRLWAWVEAAGEAETYVVLDLQPGTQDFPTQAKAFEELLVQPHVGLALDPEWRLLPGQRHMAQVGQVTAAEVNETTAWLAELVDEHRLPEKMVILHQFQTRMIPDRAEVVERDGIALLVHADGHGAPEQKLETWRSLTKDLPSGMRLGWKNFIDEDSPTFTPERTMTEVSPRPWFVSYQ